ncbi:hypothetical protein CDIK_3650 [Cucumispora dikerogammari]|nr:hypothetical protein CDIK_3650 [Cucumispora dikerogammari]
MTKRRKISTDDRQKIITKFNSSETQMQISKELSINYQTVIKIVKTHIETNEIKSRKHGGDRLSKLSEDEKTTICTWINKNCTLSLKQIKEKVQDKINKTVSVSTIDRCIREFHYTLKDITIVPKRRNTDSTIATRLEYARKFREIEIEYEDKNVVFLDEVGFCYSARTKKKKICLGTSAYVNVPAVRTRNISVLAAINKYEFLFFKTHDSPLNGETFKTGLIELRNKCLEKNISNLIFILDNARIHHYTHLISSLDEMRIKLLFLSPYSPFLNTIETGFFKWKNFVIRSQAKNETELKMYILEGFDCISQSDCDGYYRKMLGYVNRWLI